MPLTFRIIPDMALVYVQYSGQICPHETMQVFEDYVKHPDSRPGQKQLVDLRHVTKVDFDFPAFLRMQAKKAEAFHVPGFPTLVAYLADSSDTIRIARMAQRSWDGISDVIARMFTEEANALAFLGLPQTDLHALLARTA
ncbi:hypothetical protein [Aquicoccus porphyridii]|uniref:hypothetical protein n=1 Tax=Aquicoccus porphyridii TaxID=1852029 RepID=UPI00273F9176|nr:hypothetical protein [Aquicoccus porphyridii]